MYDLSKPWNKDVDGEQVLPLINSDASTIRVEAGPGTGKTFGLSRRVVRFMHPDGYGAAGSDILVVAFNRVIAKQLRKDILSALSEAEIDASIPPVIQTVHSLCLRVIHTDIRILLPHEIEAMLYDVLQSHPQIRAELEGYDAIAQALRDHEAGHRDNVTLWQAVQEWLHRHNARLIGDLPRMLLDHLQGGDFGGRSYRYVIVDEFQDLTAAEQLLFTKLREADGQFLALGDPRQSIYAFRGNDREGLRKLEELQGSRVEAIENVPMNECRRCPASLVEAANQLMSLQPTSRMLPGSTTPGNVHVVYWKTPSAEAKGMAKNILANVRAFPDQRHLVMVTRRQFGYLLRDQLQELDGSVAVDLSFSESLLEGWPAREAFLFLSLLVDPDAPTWRVWLGYQNSPPADAFKPQARNAGAYLAFLASCDDTIDAGRVAQLSQEPRKQRRGQGGTTLWDRAQRFVTLQGGVSLAGLSAAASIEHLLADDLWLHGPDADAARIDLAQMRAKALELASEMDEDADPDDTLRHVVRQLRYHIATREPFVPKEGAAVQVTTLWGAKGVTAEHVYILGLCHQALPGTRREEYPGNEIAFLDEQRRLFYVSLTRAKRTLVLSRALRVRDGAARQMGLGVAGGYWMELRMSEFLRDIMQFLPQAQTGDTWSGCG